MLPSGLLGQHFVESRLPKDLIVSTMSVTFAFSRVDSVENELMDLQSLASTIPLSTSGVCCIDYKGVLVQADGNTTRKARKRKTHNFYNSMTMDIAVSATDVRTMHFKLFKNGSVQGAGCKTTTDGDYAILALKSALESTLGIPLCVRNLKINLINVNFRIGYGINRDNLYRLLMFMGTQTNYERCKHAGVGIKYLPQNKDKPISIFVFESGSVVITGSKNEQHIIEGYKYINDLVSRHRSEVIKIPSAHLLEKFVSSLNSNPPSLSLTEKV